MRDGGFQIIFEPEIARTAIVVFVVPSKEASWEDPDVVDIRTCFQKAGAG
jgi:hypothetical protein